MCGLVGVALKHSRGFYKKQEDIFFDLLYADALRGDDATGIVFVEKDGAFGIMKEASPAYYCRDTMRESKLNKGMMQWGRAMIGHNRKATVGQIKDDTSHPFVVDKKFAMVHNGTLYSHKKLADTVVDSEALAIHLSKVLTTGFNKENLEEEIGKVDGAYAIVAFDQPTNSIYITRNAQRPLAFIETDEAIFWASEYGMLSWVLNRHGIDLQKAKSAIAKEDHLYTIDLVKGEMKEEEFKPKKPQPVTKATAVVTGGNTKVKDTSSGLTTSLSKNMFKSIKKKLIWSSLNFWADDYIEHNFPHKNIEDGETKVNLLGSILQETALGEDHSVVASIDMKDYPMLSGANLLTHMYTGRVYEMTFNSRTRQATLYMDRVTIIPKSMNLPAVIDAKYISDKLEEKEIKLTQQDKDETSTTLH